MTLHYSVETDSAKTAKARGDYLKVHFKNTRETARMLKGMTTTKALKYLKDVIHHKDIVPFNRYNRSVGRKKMANKYAGTGQGRWPEKSCKFLIELVTNLRANIEAKGLSVDTMIISHVQVSEAVKTRRRTFRAHGRITPYVNSPSNVELIASEKPVKISVPKEIAA